MAQFSVVIAGSTERTLLCAKALAKDSRFEIVGVLTPSPKPIGRKQVVTKNPMHQWAEVNHIPVILVEKKLDSEIQKTLNSQLSSLHFLLVVDFGYIVPQWLLDIPTIAPVNIHPSALPKYRGSSPGQFVLAFGEKDSAISVIVMDALLDHGPIITKIPFEVDPTWTSADYYAHAFSHIAHRLPDILAGFADNRHSTAQPDTAPTPTARMLTRDDGYVPYQTLRRLIANDKRQMTSDKLEEVPFLSTYKLPATSYQLYCMWRGLTPWPGLWTLVDGKRMKLLSLHMDGEKLFLDEVQFEGEKPKKY